jgi:hypothetical protein
MSDLDDLVADFIGLTVEEALALAGQRGLTVRHLGADGACGCPIGCVHGRVTDDLSLNRINIYTETTGSSPPDERSEPSQNIDAIWGVTGGTVSDSGPRRTAARSRNGCPRHR